MIFIFTYKV